MKTKLTKRLPVPVAALMFFASQVWAQSGPWTVGYPGSPVVLNTPGTNTTLLASHVTPPLGGGSPALHISGAGGEWQIFTNPIIGFVPPPLLIGAPATGSSSDAVEYTLTGYNGSSRFSLTVPLRFEPIAGESATWELLIGLGPTFAAGATAVDYNDVFAGLRFAFSDGSVSVEALEGTDWVSTSINIIPNATQLLRVYGNNDTCTYRYEGPDNDDYLIAPGEYHVWIGNTYYGTFSASNLLPGFNINSWEFRGYANSSSSGNSLTFGSVSYGRTIINEKPYVTTNVNGLGTLCADNIGAFTASAKYQVKGSALTGVIAISAPTDFELSTDEVNWLTSLTLPPLDGKVTQDVYVRGIGSPSVDASGDILHVSSGADDVSLPVASHVYKNFGPPGPPWTQDFGKCDIDYVGPGFTSSFVAQPTLGGGAATVFVPSSGGGEWSIAPNPFVTIGAFSLLRGEASGDNTNPVKFTTRNYSDGKEFYAKFDVAFNNPGSGDGYWYFLQGSGATFGPAAVLMSSGDVFAGLRWNFDGSAMLNLEYMSGNVWQPLQNALPVGLGNGSTFEVFSNNRPYPVTYEHSTGAKRTLAPGTWDLWKDDVFIQNIPSAGLASNTAMNSFEFRGLNNTVGSLEMYLDDLLYSNVIPNQEYVDSILFVNNRWTNQAIINAFDDPIFSGLYPFAVAYGVNAFETFPAALSAASSGASIIVMGKGDEYDPNGEYAVAAQELDVTQLSIIGTDSSGVPIANSPLMPVFLGATMTPYALRLGSAVDSLSIQNIKFSAYPNSVIESVADATPSSAVVRGCVFKNVGTSGGFVVNLANASGVEVIDNSFGLASLNADAVVRVGAVLSGLLNSSFVGNLVIEGNQFSVSSGTKFNPIVVEAKGAGVNAQVSTVFIRGNVVSNLNGVPGTAITVRDDNQAGFSRIRKLQIINNSITYDGFDPGSEGLIVLDDVSAIAPADQNVVSGNVINTLNPNSPVAGIFVTGAKTDNLVIENNDVIGSGGNFVASITIDRSNAPSNGDVLIRNNQLTGAARSLLAGSLPGNTAVNLQDNNLQTQGDGPKIENFPVGAGTLTSNCDYWGLSGVPNPATDVIGTIKIFTYKLDGLDVTPDPGFQASNNCKAFANDLQQIVNVSNPGDTILLDDTLYYIGGTYIDKPITIIGGPGSILVPDPNLTPAENNFDPSNPLTYLDDVNYDFIHGVVIASSDVTLKDVAINGNPNDDLDCQYRFGAGVITDYTQLTPYEQIRLENVKVENVYGTGIMIFNAGENNAIENSYVANACLRADGVYFENAYGIYSNAPSSTIQNNTVEYVGTGIKLDGDATLNGLDVEGNTIKFVEAYGLAIDAADGGGPVTVEGNTIEGAGIAGMALFNLPTGSQIGSEDKPNVVTVDSDNPNLFFGEGQGVGLQLANSEGVFVGYNSFETEGQESAMWMVNNGTADEPVVVKENTFLATAQDPTLTYDDLGKGTGIFISDNGDYLGGAGGDNYAVLENNEVSGFTWGLYSNGTAADGEIETTIGGDTPDKSNDFHDNRVGVVVNGSLANIRNNRTTFANNDTAVYVRGGNANIAANTFSNNTSTGIVVDNHGADQGQATIGGNSSDDSNHISGSQTGVVVRNGSLANIRNNRNTFSGNGTGIRVEMDAYAEIAGNTFTANSGAGVVVDNYAMIDLGGNTVAESNTITGSPTGVVVRNGSLANIRNNRTTFANNGTGIQIEGNAVALVTGNTFTNNSGAGIVTDGSELMLGGSDDTQSNTISGSNNGVVVRNGSLANIRNNRTTFANNNNGVVVQSGSAVNMEGNTFTNNSTAGVVVEGTGTEITIGGPTDSGSNTITGSQTGVVVRNGSLANIRNNRTTFANNNVGISVESGANVDMSGNVFTGNTSAGVIVDGAGTSVTIGGTDDTGSNTITDSDYGVVIRNGSLANIRNNRNTFAANGIGILVQGAQANMTGNVFTDNTGAGVVVENGATATIGGTDDSGSNTVTGSHVGVVVRNGSLANIRNNRTTFANNNIGVQVEGGATVDMAGNVFTDNAVTGVVVDGAGTNVTIGGVDDSGSNTVTGSQTGVLVRNGSLANIRNNRTTFAGNTNGIVVEGAQATMTGNVITGNTNAGVVVQGDGVNLTLVTIGGDSDAESNTVTGSQTGVLVRNGSLANIRNNRTTFAGNTNGIVVEGASEVYIEGNTLSANSDAGIVVDGPGTNVTIGGDGLFSSNTINDGNVGVVVRNGSLANIRNNRTTFAYCNVGVQIQGGATANMSGNTVLNNTQYGVLVEGAGTNVTIGGNEPGASNTVSGSQVGVVVRNGSLANIRNNRTTFSNNEIGIQVAGAEAFITGNVIDGNLVAGIQLIDDDDDVPGTANVYENFIGDQPVDLQNLSANPANQINAEFNWWGDSDGNVLGEIQQGVGAVDFSPWYRVDEDAEPGDEGWRGNRSLLCIGSFSPDVDGTGKFQEGIDSLIAGGTLFVVNGGIFTESAVVNKDLTFINDGDPVLGTLEINNPGGQVYMQGNFQIDGTLRMSDGILYLEDADLMIQCGGNIEPVNPASYVVTLNNAKLSVECLGTGGETDPVTFPVGTDQGPTPLTLKNSGPSDYISVSTLPTLRGNVTSGTEFTTDAVKVTWIIEEGTAGGSNFDMTAGFTAASELPGFDRNSSAIYTYFDGGWNQIQTHGPASGADPFTKTVGGVNTVGVFSVQDSLRSCQPNLIVASKAVTCDGPSSGRVVATVRFAPGQNFPVQFRLFGPVYRGWQTTGVFNNVPAGTYKVQVRRLNDQTCVVEKPITVGGLQTPIITFINNITANSARVAWNGDPANRYEIQYRQLSTMTWTTIGNLSGSQFILTGLTPSTRYEIRLRILCPDASSTAYTPIRIFQTAGSVKVESDEAKEVREQMEAAEKEIFSVYPNPTDGPVTLLFGLPEARKVHFVITDMSGRIVAEDAFMGMEGVNRNLIDMSRYPSGLYVMRYTDGVKVRTAYIQVK